MCIRDSTSTTSPLTLKVPRLKSWSFLTYWISISFLMQSSLSFSIPGRSEITMFLSLIHILYSSLCKEVNCTNFLGFFLKYTDKLFPNNLSLSFWLCNACKLRVISLLCINSYKVKVELSFWSKYALNFIAFIFTEKAVVYEYACKLLSNSS